MFCWIFEKWFDWVAYRCLVVSSALWCNRKCESALVVDNVYQVHVTQCRIRIHMGTIHPHWAVGGCNNIWMLILEYWIWLEHEYDAYVCRLTKSRRKTPNWCAWILLSHVQQFLTIIHVQFYSSLDTHSICVSPGCHLTAIHLVLSLLSSQDIPA